MEGNKGGIVRGVLGHAGANGGAIPRLFFSEEQLMKHLAMELAHYKENYNCAGGFHHGQTMKLVIEFSNEDNEADTSYCWDSRADMKRLKEMHFEEDKKDGGVI